MEFYHSKKRMRMKKLFVVLLAGFSLTACSDDVPDNAGRVGQGSMPADSVIIRVNQGALGTDLGGSPKKQDSSRRTAAAPAAATPLRDAAK